MESDLSGETKVDVLSEPSTSGSSGNSAVLQDPVSQGPVLSSDFVVDEDTNAEFDAVENLLTGPEYVHPKGEYFFKTDHPALKANSDYRKLLNTYLILQVQRRRAIKDLEKLYDIREMALADPIGFVEKLQRGENLGIPKPQKIAEIPYIDWSKYTLTPSETAFEKRQLTRQSTKIMNEILAPGRLDGEDDKSKVFSEHQKSSKSNQSWTAEEQKRLEELLVQFPPEEIETRRWEKIANELENRTPIQVASRVQKYFIKLMRAGMPIPGRQPNPVYNRKPRRQVVRQRPSTFFASYTPASYLIEDDEYINCDESQPASNDDSSDSSVEISDIEEREDDVRLTDEYREIVHIKKALKEKQKLQGLAQHIGFKCERCKCEPIIGIRWHCTDCDLSTDFCEDCVDCSHETDYHTTNHHLEAIHHAVISRLDKDYPHFPSAAFSYLDPNYVVSS